MEKKKTLKLSRKLRSKRLLSLINKNRSLVNTNSPYSSFYDLNNLNKIIVLNKKPISNTVEFDNVIDILSSYTSKGIAKISKSKFAKAYSKGGNIVAYSFFDDLSTLEDVKKGYLNYLNLGPVKLNSCIKIHEQSILVFEKDSQIKALKILLDYVKYLNENSISLENISSISDIIMSTSDNDEITISFKYPHKLRYIENLNESVNVKWFLSLFILLLLYEKNIKTIKIKNILDIYRVDNFHYMSCKFIDLVKKVFLYNKTISFKDMYDILYDELQNLCYNEADKTLYNEKRFFFKPSKSTCTCMTPEFYEDLLANERVIYKNSSFVFINKPYDSVGYVLYKYQNEESYKNIELITKHFSDIMDDGVYYASYGLEDTYRNMYKIKKVIYCDDFDLPIGFLIDYCAFYGTLGSNTLLKNFIKKNDYSRLTFLPYVICSVVRFLLHVFNDRNIVLKNPINVEDIISFRDLSKSNSDINFSIINMDNFMLEENLSDHIDKVEYFKDIVCKSVMNILTYYFCDDTNAQDILYSSMSPYIISSFESYISAKSFDVDKLYRGIMDLKDNLVVNEDSSCSSYYEKNYHNSLSLQFSFLNDDTKKGKDIFKKLSTTNYKYIDEIFKMLSEISDVNINFIDFPTQVVYYSKDTVDDKFTVYGFKYNHQKKKLYSINEINELYKDITRFNKSMKYSEFIFMIIQSISSLYNRQISFKDIDDMYVDINSIYFDSKLHAHIKASYYLHNYHMLKNRKENCYKKAFIRAIKNLYKMVGYSDYYHCGISLEYNNIITDISLFEKFSLSSERKYYYINSNFYKKKFKCVHSDSYIKTYKIGIGKLNIVIKQDLKLSDYVDYIKSLKNIYLRNVVIKNVLNDKTQNIVGYVTYMNKSRKFISKDLSAVSNKGLIKCLISFINFVISLKENKLGINICSQNIEDIISFSTNYKLYVDEIIYLKNEDEGYLSDDITNFFIKYINEAIGFDTEAVSKVSKLFDMHEYIEAREFLKSYLGKMDKYCIFDNIYYSSKKFGKCPICKEEHIVLNLSSVENENVFSDIGKEAIIYDLGNGYLAKIYKTTDLNGEYVEVSNLVRKREVISKLIKCKNFNDTHDFGFDIANVKGVVIDDKRQLRGVIINKINNSKNLSLLTDKRNLEKFNISLKDRLKMMISLCNAVEYCHLNGFCICDVSCNNILFDTSKTITLIDIDSSNTKENQPSLYTEPFMDPDSIVPNENDNNKGIFIASYNTDYYNIALIVFYILTLIHPFYGGYKDTNGNNMEWEKRMALRISVLGDHDVKIPPIVEKWDWMSEELKEAFLDIFERGKRYNIGKVLADEYKKLYGEKSYDKDIINIDTIKDNINM